MSNKSDESKKAEKLHIQPSGVKITYNILRENATLPIPATRLSGGLDVTAASIEHITPNEVLVYLGLAMQPPEGYRIRFSPRSSFTKYNWIVQNTPCLGDADFPGEYRIRFRAIPIGGSIIKDPFLEDEDEYILDQDDILYEPFPYKVGDRVAQMYLEEVIPVYFQEGELPHSTDRKGGFGSTGR